MIELKDLDDSTLPSQEWQAFAPLQEQKEKLAAFMWSLPIEDFRAQKYTPPPLPADAPIPNKDLVINERQIIVSDGHQISMRIYQSLKAPRGALLFLNAHGGGMVNYVLVS
jgi:acetyl esterase/lipase